MRTIEIDDDRYAFITNQTTEFGEPAAEILRRLPGIPRQPTDGAPANGQHELADVLGNPGLKFKSAAERYRFILGEAYKLMPDSFKNILAIQGRERKYFATSKSESKPKEATLNAGRFPVRPTGR